MGCLGYAGLFFLPALSVGAWVRGGWACRRQPFVGRRESGDRCTLFGMQLRSWFHSMRLVTCAQLACLCCGPARRSASYLDYPQDKLVLSGWVLFWRTLVDWRLAGRWLSRPLGRLFSCTPPLHSSCLPATDEANPLTCVAVAGLPLSGPTMYRCGVTA